MSSKFVLARKDGIIIHIRDIPLTLRGKNCGASCPVCDEPLIAKLGKVRSHHFTHSKNTECEFNNESAIHLLAKEIICEYKTIILPEIALKYIVKSIHHEENEEYVDYSEKAPIIIDEVIKTNYQGQDLYDYISYEGTHEPERILLTDLKNYTLAKGTRVNFNSIELEKGHKGKIIDLIGKKNNTELGIEIKVTHAVDREKKLYLRTNNFATIEIDLSSYIENIEDFHIEDFKNTLINTSENNHWIVLKDELNIVNKVEEIIKKRYIVPNEAALNDAKTIKNNKMEEKRKYQESPGYKYDRRITLYMNKEYKKIQQEYFIDVNVEIELQNKLLNIMLDSGRFNIKSVGKFIPASIKYFNCDASTWQTIIYYKFIYSKEIGTSFNVKEIIKFFNTYSNVKGYFDTNFYEYSKLNNDVTRLRLVICDYLEYLCELNILKVENIDLIRGYYFGDYFKEPETDFFILK